MSKKVQSWLIPENVYRSPILLVFENDPKKAKEFIEKNWHKCPDLCWDVGAKTLSKAGEPVVVIWIRNKNLFPMIFHEIVHAVNEILGTRGIQLNNDTEEAYAYLSEYFANEMLIRLGHKKFTYASKI